MSSAWFAILVLHSVLVVKGEELSFSSPQLSEEEEHSGFIPSNLKCDACAAVAYQINLALLKEEKKKSGKALKESEYLDVFEKVCNSKTFDTYGLKNVGGTNRISGAGLETDKEYGMLMGGGKWPGRMSTKCFSFIDELGEDMIYEQFRQKDDLKKFLCNIVTKDCHHEEDTESEEQEEGEL